MNFIAKFVASLDPGFLVGIIISIFLWSLVIVILVAVKSSKKNVLFTQPKEGTAKAVLRGESFDKMVMAWEGHHLNSPGSAWYNTSRPDWEVLLNHQKDKPDRNPIWTREKWMNGRSFLEKKFGVYWVGIPLFKKVHTYMFEWTEETQSTDGTYKAWPRKHQTDFIYVKDFPYHITIKDVETSDNIPVKVQYVLTLRINNPHKALFKVEDWLKKTTASANSEVRNHVGATSFEELTSEKHSKTKKEKEVQLVTSILCLNKNLPSSDDVDIEQMRSNGGVVSLPVLYGVTIIGAEIQAIDPSTELGIKAKEALTALYVAERQAAVKNVESATYKNNVVTRAEGDKAAQILEAEGAAEARRRLALAKHDAYNDISSADDGLELERLDTLRTVGEKNGNTVIVDGKRFLPIIQTGNKKGSDNE